jgi:ABC-type antimicrobial peptide transport system permease subunit
VSHNAIHGEFTEGAQPWLYLPLAQHPENELVVQIRTKPGSAVAAGVLAVVSSLDPDLFIEPLKPFELHLRDFLTFRRLVTFCVALYGSMALLMAATGLFGVISYSAAQRTREIGIRMALGADRNQVVTMVLRESILIGALGTALGTAASFPLSQSLHSFLYRVPPLDLPTYVGVTLVVVTVAVLASLGPARHTAQLDPAAVLREE